MISEIFTISSLVFTISLLVTYLFQIKVKNTKNYLYKRLLILDIITCVIEIISVAFLKNENLLVGTIFAKIKMTLLILFSFVNYLYLLVYINRNYEMTTKELLGKIGFKLLYIILGLAIIALFIQPTTDYFNEKVLFFGGYTESIFIGTIVCILATLLIQSLLKIKEQTGKDKLYIALMFIIYILFVTHQVFFRDISFVLLGYTLLLYLMYLTLENPDLSTLEELEKNNSNAERYSGSKINFLSNMSEDIKKPLFEINNTIRKIIATEEADEVAIKTDLKSIDTSSYELLDIMNNILAISTIDNGNENINKKVYNPKEMINKLIETTNEKLSAKGVTFAVGIAENIPEKLVGDFDKVNQLLTNLLNNAVEYTNTGKVTFVVSCDNIENVTNLHFKVNDTGIGISEADKETIFTKTDNTDKKGIGLVIVKKYVELMDGKIWFESKEHLGTTFYIDLPQEIGKDESNSYIDLKGKKVLIVDDNRLNLTVAKKLLELHNLEVVTATTGEECINIINSTMQFDLLFLDHSMPGMDGVETLKKIKTLNVRTKIPPIIAFTANAIEGMKEQYEREGFDGYLSKPIDKNDLDRILAKYLK